MVKARRDALRPTHTDPDFRVDLTFHERDRRYVESADLAEDLLDVGIGDTPQEAAGDALTALGEPYATEKAEDASLEGLHFTG